ncbi:MAG: DNRLRE domain-containing protein [Dehalococcoidia bacterium]|nr:DNRLRE domain-containing protein [Dehalococcoidia bacterium]
MASAQTLEVTYKTSTADFQPSDADLADGGKDMPGAYEDTYILGSATDQPEGDEDHLSIDLSDANRSDALLRFHLDSIQDSLSGSRVLSATLTLQVKDSSDARPLRVFRICRPSSLSIDGAVTSAAQDGVSYGEFVPDGSDDAVSYGSGSTAPVDFDVTGIVQEWADGEVNAGFWIEQDGNSSSTPSYLRFHSFNAADESLRPHLEIEYVEDEGEENTTPSPQCTEATPTPTPTDTPTPEDTATSTPEPTETPTPEPTATPEPTETPTPDGPQTSAELQLTGPSLDGPVSRSRLAFVAGTGDITADAVTLVIQRTSDDLYWDAGAAAWVEDEVANAATDNAGAWRLPVTGVDMRAFGKHHGRSHRPRRGRRRQLRQRRHLHRHHPLTRIMDIPPRSYGITPHALGPAPDTGHAATALG